jgi:hypothetical protein
VDEINPGDYQRAGDICSRQDKEQYCQPETDHADKKQAAENHRV